MKRSLRSELRGVSREEAKELIEILQRVVDGEDVPELRKPDPCPWCGSDKVVRKGHDRDGGQRWLCRSCRRTFNMTTCHELAEQVEPVEALDPVYELPDEEAAAS